MKKRIKKLVLSNVKFACKYLPRYYNESRKYRRYYNDKFDKAKIKKNTILYEVRDGQSMTDSPLYIFMEIIKNNDFNNFRHIWVMKSDVEYENFIINVPEEFRYKIEIVKRNTIQYVHWLLEAEYLITNSTFQNFFHKRKGQVYINTWHGTPLKYMGYDIPGSKTSLKNVQRNFMMTDYILSPNKHTSDIFLKRYKLDGLYEGKILETGYPRNDRLHSADDSIIDDLKVNDIILSGKPIVLYTPTWRGTSISNPADNIKQLLAEIKVLQKYNMDKQILVKTHPYVYKDASRNLELRKFLIPDFIDSNRLLSIVDVLVTDYSSIFFDFLVTGKKIVFYSWDKEQYELYRGMYLDDSEFPAPIFTHIEDASKYVGSNKNFLTSSYIKLKERMTYYEDGFVTQRVVKRIFQNIELSKGNEIKLNNKKKKLLIFTGGMINNGITASLQNLTNNINYNKYDVSILTWDSNLLEKINNINKLDSRVRIIYRFGWSSLTFFEILCDKLISNFGIQKWNKFIVPIHGYKREVHRLLGDNYFYSAIDFSGYSFNGSKIIAFSNSKIKSVFQHNDLWKDAHKVIKGKQPNKKGLMALFSLYYKFDHIVSVSEKLAKINEKKLKRYLKIGQQTFSNNTLNLENNLKDTNFDNNIKLEQIYQSVTLIHLDSYVYSDLSQINNGLKINKKFSKEDELVGVTKAIIEDNIFIKITKNGLPDVWINANDLNFNENIKIISDEYKKQVIWIKPNNIVIRENPYGVGENINITRGCLLNNSFAQAVRIVRTTEGEYIQFEILGTHKLGFINKEFVNMLSTKKLTFIQKIWNINKHVEDSIDLTPKLIRYKGKDNEILCWNESSKLRFKSKVLNNSFYLVDTTSIYKNNEFLRVIDKNNNYFWISNKNIEVLDLHKVVDEIGISQEMLLAADQTDDGRKIVKNHFGDLDKNNNIIILSIVDELKNIESILLFNVIKNSFYWINKVLINKIDNSSLEVIDDLTHQDVEKYIFAIQSKFKVNTDKLDQIKALDIKPINNNDILNKRTLEDSEMNLLKDTLINIFDKINGNILQKKVLILNFIKIDKLLIKGGEIWFNGYYADGRSYIFQIDNELFEEKNIKANNSTNLKLEPDQFVNKLNYMAMGRLSPEKNQISLLIAFKKVLKYKTNAYLWILGDGKMREELETLANLLHIKNNVIFWGFRNNPQDFLKKSDIFVHPSYYEGQPMVLLEALNQNALVVASNIVANVSVLGNQKYGLIMKGVTPEDIQEGMLKIVDNLFDFNIFDENKYNKNAIDRFMTVVTNN